MALFFHIYSQIKEKLIIIPAFKKYFLRNEFLLELFT